jgi:hypothetical protein
MFFFFFNLFVTFYRRIKRPKFFSEFNQLTFPSLKDDKIGELRSEAQGGASEMTSPQATSPFNRFRGSIAWTEGFEKNLHVLAKDQYPERSMGVFTSGGDAQGIHLFKHYLNTLKYYFRNESSGSSSCSYGYLPWL